MRLYYVKDIPSGYPVSGVIPCASKIAALEGFKRYLKGNESYDPRCYSMYCLDVDIGEDMALSFIRGDGLATFICTGDKVDVALEKAISELPSEEV